MDFVRIKVVAPRGIAREMTVPTNVAFGELIPSIIERLYLPTANNGQPIVYCLMHEKQKTVYKPSHTAKSVGIQPSDTIVILEEGNLPQQKCQ